MTRTKAPAQVVLLPLLLPWRRLSLLSAGRPPDSIIPPLTMLSPELFSKSLQGAENARIISIAFFALYVYEVGFSFFVVNSRLTRNSPVFLDWGMDAFEIPLLACRSPFFTERTRLMVLQNRYIPFLVMILGLVAKAFPLCIQKTNCAPLIQIGFVGNIVALGIIQAMLAIRIWHLFSNSRAIQWTTALAFALSFASSLAFAIATGIELKLLHPADHLARVAVGCQAARPSNFWRMFFPSLVLHTLLFVLTAVRALRNRRILKHAPILKRLLRDGGFFYFIVFVSVGFSGIGSFLTKDPLINIPVIFSNFLISVTAIAMSRVMFSIHSLAACLGSDTAWLLNNVELSRVNWRKGATEGEIIVDRWSAEEDTDEESVYPASFKVTRVGVYNDAAML
ncbi:hypothetical protein C8J56DRAFT_1076364 [Mycena floridula]|nr:hypothetical protein C8J56DRAFT_1076364 [Mycena floridula]